MTRRAALAAIASALFVCAAPASFIPRRPVPKYFGELRIGEEFTWDGQWWRKFGPGVNDGNCNWIAGVPNAANCDDNSACVFWDCNPVNW